MNTDVQNLFGRIKTWYNATNQRMAKDKSVWGSCWVVAKYGAVILAGLVAAGALSYIHPVLFFIVMAGVMATIAVQYARNHNE